MLAATSMFELCFLSRSGLASYLCTGLLVQSHRQRSSHILPDGIHGEMANRSSCCFHCTKTLIYLVNVLFWVSATPLFRFFPTRVFIAPIFLLSLDAWSRLAWSGHMAACEKWRNCRCYPRPQLPHSISSVHSLRVPCHYHRLPGLLRGSDWKPMHDHHSRSSLYSIIYQYDHQYCPDWPQYIRICL